MSHEKDLVISYFDGKLEERFSAGGGDTFKAAVTSIETKGVNPSRGRIVEMALLMLEVRREPLEFVRLLSKSHDFEDPQEEINERYTAATGITSGMVVGKKMDDKVAEEAFQSADIVITYNAGDVRPFLEKRYPVLEGKVFACCRNQIEWPMKGFECRSLKHLCQDHGWYYSSMRADVIASAIVKLLTHRDKESGECHLAELVRRANEPLITIEVDVPPNFRNLIRRERFKWDNGRRMWTRSLGTSSLERLRQSLESKGFTGELVEIERLPATERFK